MHQIRQCFSRSPGIKFDLNIQNLFFHGQIGFIFILVAVKRNISLLILIWKSQAHVKMYLSKHRLESEIK